MQGKKCSVLGEPNNKNKNKNAGAILNILAKSSAFPAAIKAQAAKVRDVVRNQWAHAIIEDWDDALLGAAFTEMENLAKLLPDNGDLLQELDMDKKGTKKADCQLKEQLLLIDMYRNGVKGGNQLRVHEKIKKLESVNNV